MPSTFCTTQFPRFTGLVRSPGEFWGHEDGHGEDASTPVFVGIVDADPVVQVAVDSRDSVVLGQDWVDESVVAIEKVEDGPVVLNGVFDVADGFLKHGFAEIVVELRETRTIDGVVVFKETEVEPVAGELRGQAADAGVLQHAAGLGEEDCGFLQVVRCGVA